MFAPSDLLYIWNSSLSDSKKEDIRNSKSVLKITVLLYLKPGFSSPEIPLVLALITSVGLTAWVTVYLFHEISAPKPALLQDYHPGATKIWWPCESPQ